MGNTSCAVTPTTHTQNRYEDPSTFYYDLSTASVQCNTAELVNLMNIKVTATPNHTHTLLPGDVYQDFVINLTDLNGEIIHDNINIKFSAIIFGDTGALQSFVPPVKLETSSEPYAFTNANYYLAKYLGLDTLHATFQNRFTSTDNVVFVSQYDLRLTFSVHYYYPYEGAWLLTPQVATNGALQLFNTNNTLESRITVDITLTPDNSNILEMTYRIYDFYIYTKSGDKLERGPVQSNIFQSIIVLGNPDFKIFGSKLWISGCTLREQLSSLSNYACTNFTDENLVAYALAKYILAAVLYGRFDLDYLDANFNYQFMQDLANSQFRGYIDFFTNPEYQVVGFESYFVNRFSSISLMKCQ